MIHNNTQISFKGYDALPLRALYMQGIRRRGEANIFREMRGIAKKEGIGLYVNQNCTELADRLLYMANFDKLLSIWGQDNKAFVINKNGKTLLWNTKENLMPQHSMGDLKDFTINAKSYMPRGGNYFLGYKPNGEKWLLINSMSIYDRDAFEKCYDAPTQEHLCELFDVKPENIYKLTDYSNDIDEIIRPIGYPNILVNDYRLSLENLVKMKKKFPQSDESYNAIIKYLDQRLMEEETMDIVRNCDETCDILKGYGFNPIRIGGRYLDDINYMNAIAFQNNNGGISYITNSTKNSYPELEYLEKLFRVDLKEKCPDVTKTYFVSGGPRIREEKNLKTFDALYGAGLTNRNVIMDILANRLGGIHCMTAEIPDFDKIEQNLLGLTI